MKNKTLGMEEFYRNCLKNKLKEILNYLEKINTIFFFRKFSVNFALILYKFSLNS